jgi:hypothetical protein
VNRLAFRIDSKGLDIGMYVLDGLYLLDIIMHFFVAAEHPITGDLVLDKKAIAINYFK